MKNQTQIDLKASLFLKNLKNGEKLSSFFSDHWKLIYHEDNRCDGSTDGQIDHLKNTQIDSKITLPVKEANTSATPLNTTKKPNTSSSSAREIFLANLKVNANIYGAPYAPSCAT